MSPLTHLNRKGEAAMVDVSAKPPVRREAVAEGRILLQPATLDLIRKNQVKKGDVLSIARIAGIQAAKQTQYLIPLCHQIPLSKVQVDFELRPKAVQSPNQPHHRLDEHRQTLRIHVFHEIHMVVGPIFA